jgi:glycosidase
MNSNYHSSLSRILSLFALGLFMFTAACTQPSTVDSAAPVSKVTQPEWSKNATIYEINVRQYTPEGTFSAFSEHLPRLKEMGVDILWFMPIHPIGKINRKENENSMGSYYSVQDYKAVSSDYGTAEDFRAVVQQAHSLEMKVILDWVPNHTAWDNPWTENKDWYVLNEEGDFIPPLGTDWTDVIQLDYTNEEMRAAMIDAMKYWVAEFGVDGYRCDVAGMVPTDFWIRAHAELDEVKDVFMLAEDGEPELLIEAFDMNYAWEYAHIIREIAKGAMTFDRLDSLLAEDAKKFPENSYRMYFTSNHDENSWNGTDIEMYGDNFQNFAVLSATIDGMPLVYSGQEAVLDKQLLFFEKDEIEWKDYALVDFYTDLLALNKRNEALWNGAHGANPVRISSPEGSYAYQRNKDDFGVYVGLNNTQMAQEISFPLEAGTTYKVYGMDFVEYEANSNDVVSIPANSWLIFSTH